MPPVTPHRPSLAVPSTQNTALVLDFRCLYTHDIRRKSKRWQDGHLRFHTFNRRVMVYNVTRDFVGDCHWRETRDLADGDEFELERGGILVQVSEALGQTEQDLTVLFEKRLKDREEKRQSLAQHSTPLKQLASSRTLATPLNRPPGLGRPSTVRSQVLNPISRLPPHKSSPVSRSVRPPSHNVVGVDGGPTEERRSKKRKLRDGFESPTSESRRLHTNTSRDETTNKRSKGDSGHDRGKHNDMDVEELLSIFSPDETPLLQPGSLRKPRPSKRVSPEAQSAHRRQAKDILQQAANPIRLAGRLARKKLLCQTLSPTRPTPALPSAHITPPYRAPSPPCSAPTAELNKFHQAQTERVQARLDRRPRPEMAGSPQLPQTKQGNTSRSQGTSARATLRHIDNPASRQPGNGPKITSAAAGKAIIQQRQEEAPTNPDRATNPKRTPARRSPRPAIAPPETVKADGGWYQCPWTVETSDLFDWKPPPSLRV